MGVKLRVLNGKLKNRRGENKGPEVAVTRERFVIGSSDECHMRCPSSSISPRHCEITSHGEQVLLRDLDSDTGTFLNGQRIAAEQLLHDGDHLRLGRLEFEVCLRTPKPPPKDDPVGELVSELLVEADEEERATRLADPQLRHFHREPPTAQPPSVTPPEDKLTALRKKLPPKKPPAKLPPLPSLTTDTSTAAAEETLKKILEPPKRKGRG